MRTNQPCKEEEETGSGKPRGEHERGELRNRKETGVTHADISTLLSQRPLSPQLNSYGPLGLDCNYSAIVAQKPPWAVHTRMSVAVIQRNFI